MGILKTIHTLDEMKDYLRLNPIDICWYGPKSFDIAELDHIFNIKGILSCYGDNSFNKAIPIISNDKAGLRNKFSIDNLASKLDGENLLDPFIKKFNINSILPYDVSVDLEEYCKNNGIKLFSASDHLKDLLRDKTKIDNVSRAIGLQPIPGIPGVIDDFEFEPLKARFGLPLFLHFAEGAGGTGNYIVDTFAEFERVKKLKTGRKLNVKKYFVGRSSSIDVCVTPNDVVCGALEEMLIGAPPLNTNPTEYVASSWFENNYSKDVRVRISEIGEKIGIYLRDRGFLGFFHPDFLINEQDEIYLTELNMRFGGSCGVYARIQLMNNQIPLMLIHALSFINPSIKYDIKQINRSNLKPLNYGLLNIKNYFGKEVLVNKTFRSGIYKLLNGRLQITKATEFSQLSDTKHIHISSLPHSDENTVVGNGAPICQILTRFPISNSAGQLNEEAKTIIDLVLSEAII
jgi:hypothetical protein